MIKKVFGLLTALFVVSCSVETMNTAPISQKQKPSSIYAQEISTPMDLYSNTKISLEQVKYTSDITNTISDFPTFSNKKLNEQIRVLKFNLQEYVYAIKNHNPKGKEFALKKYTQAIKKIQDMKSQLNPDEAELINRLLVKVKTNITMLESISPKSK